MLACRPRVVDQQAAPSCSPTMSGLAPLLAGECDGSSAATAQQSAATQAPLRGAPTASRPNHSLPAAACQYTSAHGPRSSDSTATTRPSRLSSAGDSAARALSKTAPSFWPSSTARPPNTSPEPRASKSPLERPQRDHRALQRALRAPLNSSTLPAASCSGGSTSWAPLSCRSEAVSKSEEEAQTSTCCSHTWS